MSLALILTTIFPTVLALITVLISYLTFARNRTLENQNIIYRYRLDKYYAVLNSISTLYGELDEIVERYYNELDDKNKKDILEKLSDEAFELLNGFYKKIYADAALLPNEIMQEIVKLVNKLQEIDLLPTEKQDKYERTLDLLATIDPYVDSIEKAMRKDLRLSELDSAIHQRLAKSELNNRLKRIAHTKLHLTREG